METAFYPIPVTRIVYPCPLCATMPMEGWFTDDTQFRRWHETCAKKALGLATVKHGNNAALYCGSCGDEAQPFPYSIIHDSHGRPWHEDCAGAELGRMPERVQGDTF
jgi:hypothetical protein